MLRRVIPFTVVAVFLTGACAFAFSPSRSMLGRVVRHGFFAPDRGFTPAPRPSDSLLYQTQGGAPGTYCPTPPRGSQKAADADTKLAEDLLPARTSSADPKSDSLLLGPAQTKCNVPAAQPAATQTIVP